MEILSQFLLTAGAIGGGVLAYLASAFYIAEWWLDGGANDKENIRFLLSFLWIPLALVAGAILHFP